MSRSRPSPCPALRVLAAAAAAAALLLAQPVASNPPRVNDLRYGTVLFSFYQQDYFDALTELLAAQQQQRLTHHRREAELLRGGLNLSYGLHDEAERVFRRLLSRDTEPRIRNRAWYYLARTTYEKGLYDQAVAALAEMDLELAMDLEGERQLLLALVRMAQEDYQGAVAALEPWRGQDETRPFADYNRAIALIRTGDSAAGIAILSELGTLRTHDAELLALRDKANMAAGFALLQDEQPERAREHLERVHIDGPHSSQALLLAGLSESASGRHRQALTPLSVLEQRPTDDPSVQHALLAIPQAHAGMGLYQRAAELFEQSIVILQREARQLDTTMRRIEQGELIAALVLEERMRDAPGHRLAVPGQRYLIQLLSGHHFQQTFQNYLDLRALENNLDYWARSMDSFDHMLETQRTRYQTQLAELRRRLENLDKDSLRARRRRLGEEIARIERRGEILAVATAGERRQWEKLLLLDREITRLPPTPKAIDLQIRFWRFLGTFIRELDREFLPRLRALQNELDTVDAAIDELGRRQDEVAALQRRVLARFDDFAKRIETERARLEQVRPAVIAAARDHRDRLQALALSELQHRRQQLDEQISQARYALARVHDEASAAPARSPSL